MACENDLSSSRNKFPTGIETLSGSAPIASVVTNMPEQCPHLQERKAQIALLKTKCFHCYVPLVIAEGVCASCGSKQPYWQYFYGGWPAGVIIPYNGEKVPAIVACFGETKKMIVCEWRIQTILSG